MSIIEGDRPVAELANVLCFHVLVLTFSLTIGLEMELIGKADCFPFVSFSDPDELVGITEVELGKDVAPWRSSQADDMSCKG